MTKVESKRQVALVAAEKNFVAAAERLAKWQRQQQELISWVDTLQAQFASEQATQKAALQAAQKAASQVKLNAVENALQLADQIETQLANIGATTGTTNPTSTASQAAAQFDRILAAEQASTNAVTAVR